MTDLEFENIQVLHLLQALLGSVTSDIRAIALHCTSNLLTVTFVLFHENSEFQEDLDDILFEFECLQSKNIAIAANVIVDSTTSIDELVGSDRLVFLRK